MKKKIKLLRKEKNPTHKEVLMHTIIDGDGLLYQAAYNVKNVVKAFDKFQDKIKQLKAVDWDQSGETTIFIEGKGNWRKDLFSGYKASRKQSQSVDPNKELRWELAQFLIEEKLVIPAVGCETDDLVRRKAVNMMNRGQPYIVVSADKDLDMVVGPHIRFDTKWQFKEYTVDQDKSDYAYFYQLMMGDMTDNIRSPKGLGDKGVRKILDANPRDRWRSLVEKEYKERCGSEWLHALYFTGSLIHIQRHKDDMFNWEKKGTWYDLEFSGVPTCYPYTDIQLGK